MGGGVGGKTGSEGARSWLVRRRTVWMVRWVNPGVLRSLVPSAEGYELK